MSTDQPTDDQTDGEPATVAPVPDPADTPDNAEVNDKVDGDDVDGDDKGKPGREAAKYRTRLRAVEAERDNLTTQLDALRRAEVERVAKTAGLNAKAFWAGGADLDDLMADDESGTVDVEKVKVAAQVSATTLGLTRKWPDSGQGNRGSALGRGKATWGDAFEAARQ